MGKNVTLGGDRLGSGNKMRVKLHGFERSTHDLGYIWRSTLAPGTLVPFMKYVALPGDTFDINLGANVKTHPTVAPLFGSFKMQLDVFVCPMRLYIGQLHNNKLGIGMEMSKVILPKIQLTGPKIDLRKSKQVEEQQISPSSILSYLGIRGIGTQKMAGSLTRKFNAIPFIAYWDIYKNYYANKQEEIGAVLHTSSPRRTDLYLEKAKLIVGEDIVYKQLDNTSNNIVDLSLPIEADNGATFSVEFDMNKPYTDIPISAINIAIGLTDQTGKYKYSGHLSGQMQDIDGSPTWNVQILNSSDANGVYKAQYSINGAALLQALKNGNPSASEDITGIRIVLETVSADYNQGSGEPNEQQTTNVQTFKLENIDTMRENILKQTSGELLITGSETSLPPYTWVNNEWKSGYMCAQFSQEGLALKTYQSDIFNNWLNTEWLDGDNGINAITAINTEAGSFSLDTLNLAQKVYDMLNRVAVSGGTYDDWVEAVYDHSPMRRAESPIYMGGMSQEVIFNEVVNTAQTEGNPLGDLGGKGNLAGNQKGGKLHIKVDEPSYIIGIVSLTPRVDYSQGNDWDVNLNTIDDLHKPSLDAIGFQDLLTEWMAAGTTTIENGQPQYKSVGKQPSWINYMTDHNRCYGNFALQNNQMYMTLNRRYEYEEITTGENVGELGIKDLTTYIDPSKFNYAFADTSIDAQNFWVQIAVDTTARRKMSARQIPNL